MNPAKMIALYISTVQSSERCNSVAGVLMGQLPTLTKYNGNYFIQSARIRFSFFSFFHELKVPENEQSINK